MQRDLELARMDTELKSQEIVRLSRDLDESRNATASNVRTIFNHLSPANLCYSPYSAL